jgi:hypothetical protein
MSEQQQQMPPLEHTADQAPPPLEMQGKKEPYEYGVNLRTAQMLCQSTIVPDTFRGNVGNCLIALDLAKRLDMNPLLVMQNMYIVKGKPAWSAQFVIAMINSSRRYDEPLQYSVTGTGDSMSCVAHTSRNGVTLTGPKVTMEMAKAEGWGAKWKTMPEVMIQYRAASFFGRLHCPDLLLGLYTAEEADEIDGQTVTRGTQRSPLQAKKEGQA